jgi:hypothetical protein
MIGYILYISLLYSNILDNFLIYLNLYTYTFIYGMQCTNLADHDYIWARLTQNAT